MFEDLPWKEWIIPAQICAFVLLGLALANAQQSLQKWARENGFEILRRQYCWFGAGPYTWSRSQAQVVYYIEVSDSEGRRRQGWVRLGNPFLGIWVASPHIKVSWKE